MRGLTESVVEEAALTWRESAGWQLRKVAEIAPGEPAAERDDYGQVVLARRLRDALLPKLLARDLRVKGAERCAEMMAWRTPRSHPDERASRVSLWHNAPSTANGTPIDRSRQL